MDVTRAIRRLQLHVTYADDDTGGLAAVISGIIDVLEPIEARAVIRHAYWRMPEVPSDALSQAVGGPPRLQQLAGRGPVIGCCLRCGRGIRAYDRDTTDLVGNEECATCTASGSRRPGRITSTEFEWEFERPPQPWQLQEVCQPIVGRSRRWAEDYPSPEVT